MYIVEFILIQIFCIVYLRYLFKNKTTPGSVSAYGAIILLELLSLYNLWEYRSVLEKVFSYIFK
ncbi:hypothetical protein HNP38_002140 [Chryseobacterium defluvii]|uniref:Uncharacterized protein n=1 Tax=Chryseobacterium defluvii TaxID=160396 RepID=A0A840KGL2_9FLAO|nr:hypothetical protein [Chryseobacterium defluvii]